MSQLRGSEEDLYTIISSAVKYSSPLSINVEQSMAQPKIRRKRNRNYASHSIHMSSQPSPSLHHMHICNERVRRANMKSMLSTLHSHLPGFHGKANKITIVDEAIAYIKSLQSIMKDLEERRSEIELLAFHDDSQQMKDDQKSDHNVQIPNNYVNILESNVAGNHVFLTIMCSRKAGVLPKIIQVLNENGMEIEEVTMSAARCSEVVCIVHAVVSNNSNRNVTMKAINSTINELKAISIPSGHEA